MKGTHELRNNKMLIIVTLKINTRVAYFTFGCVALFFSSADVCWFDRYIQLIGNIVNCQHVCIWLLRYEALLQCYIWIYPRFFIRFRFLLCCWCYFTFFSMLMPLLLTIIVVLFECSLYLCMCVYESECVVFCSTSAFSLKWIFGLPFFIYVHHKKMLMDSRFFRSFSQLLFSRSTLRMLGVVVIGNRWLRAKQI